MIQLTAAEVALAVDGQLIGFAEVVISGSVETDSRLVTPGSLFIAKPGEVTDGHNFLHSAKEAGAVVAIVERETAGLEISQIVVADSVIALGKLATYVLDRIREQSKINVIAVTGSNGKTTTKNMLREILSKFGETVAPIESYNNEVGAPISMLKASFETRFLVVEMGAGGVGSIDYLAQMCKPDIAVVLKVGLAHVGEFGGIEFTSAIKAELPKALDSKAKLILNADDSYVREMAEQTKAVVSWFGTASESEYQALGQTLSLTGTTFELRWPDEKLNKVNLQILGEHHVMNATAALAVADQLGLDRDSAIAAIEAMELAERWRMQIFETPNGAFIINDAYNASPDSMKAGLQTLAQLGKLGHRTIAVLGEMAELGAFAAHEHDAIGRLVVRLNIDHLVVVGERAKLIHMGATQEGSWDGESEFFDSIDEAFHRVRAMLTSGDVVLVKSSKSANLRFLGDDLAEVNR